MMGRGQAPEGKIALVTGAGQGIGLGLARALASAAYKVMLADLEDELLEQRAAELSRAGFGVVGQHLDVTSSDQWDRALAALAASWGSLDLLVNCAGISPRGTAESTTEALWDQTLA